MTNREIFRTGTGRGEMDVVLYDEEDEELDLEIDFHANGTTLRAPLGVEQVFRLYEALGRFMEKKVKATKELSAAHALTTQTQLDRARNVCSKVELLYLRAVVSNWKSMDEVILAAPEAMAAQLLQALDALAVVHDAEGESRGVDAAMEWVNRSESARKEPG